MCHQVKPISEFGVSNRYAGGHRTWCRDCRKEDHKRYYKQNAENISQRTSEYQKGHPREYWAYSTMFGHKRRGCEVLVSRKELIDLAYSVDFCEICGDSLDWGLIGKNGSPLDNSPTLDRTNQEKVLALHNVQIVCSRCNVSKNSRTMQEFIDYCKLVAQRYKS